MKTFPPSPSQKAFTILEVMVAMAIFFVALFAILDLTSRSLKAARSLEPFHVDASSIAAQLSLTNRLVEGVESGDFGDLYPEYGWTQEITQIATNGLFQVNFTVFNASNKRVASATTSIMMYRPLSPPGAQFGGAR
jgi:prepilin-type N-terminal cleavage/methylation domain-containing protein